MNKLAITILLFSLPLLLFSKSEWKGGDKIMHFLGSASITFWSYGIANDFFEQNDNISTSSSVTFSISLGLTKEFSDKYIKKTKFSWYDLAYDIAGTSFGLILINNLR